MLCCLALSLSECVSIHVHVHTHMYIKDANTYKNVHEDFFFQRFL